MLYLQAPRPAGATPGSTEAPTCTRSAQSRSVTAPPQMLGSWLKQVLDRVTPYGGGLSERWPQVIPRALGFKLRGERYQRRLVAGATNELDRERKPV